MEKVVDPCPLCANAKHMKKGKPLYGYRICKKCYYAFANRRQFAFLIDLLSWRVMMLPISFLIGFTLAFWGVERSAIAASATLIGWLLLTVFFCKDSFCGQSPGKALLGVRVIDTRSGQPASVVSSFKRNLPLLIPFMPLIVGGRLCSGYRIGDKWAHTKVIWNKHAGHPIFVVDAPAM
jgi:uncharacterized RDD family membrane protein YckC